MNSCKNNSNNDTQHIIKEYAYVTITNPDGSKQPAKIQGLTIKNKDFTFNLVDRKTDVKILNLIFEG